MRSGAAAGNSRETCPLGDPGPQKIIEEKVVKQLTFVMEGNLRTATTSPMKNGWSTPFSVNRKPGNRPANSSKPKKPRRKTPQNHPTNSLRDRAAAWLGFPTTPSRTGLETWQEDWIDARTVTRPRWLVCLNNIQPPNKKRLALGFRFKTYSPHGRIGLKAWNPPPKKRRRRSGGVPFCVHCNTLFWGSPSDKECGFVFWLPYTNQKGVPNPKKRQTLMAFAWLCSEDE